MKEELLKKLLTRVILDTYQTYDKDNTVEYRIYDAEYYTYTQITKEEYTYLKSLDQ